MESSDIRNEFAFSIIDFKNDEEALNKHIADGHNENDLRRSVWLRIFESFCFVPDELFNGQLITITDEINH